MADTTTTENTSNGGKININMKMGCCGGGGSSGGGGGGSGADGKSAYELAVEAGFSGTLEEWLASLKGETGPAGAAGPQGPQGPTGPQGPAGPAGGGLSDAPLDGKLYGRKDGAWVEVSSGGGGGGGDGPTPQTDPDLFTAVAFTEPGTHSWTVPDVAGVYVTMCGAGGYGCANSGGSGYYVGGGAAAIFRKYVPIPGRLVGTTLTVRVGGGDRFDYESTPPPASERRSYIPELDVVCLPGGDASETAPGAAGGEGGYAGALEQIDSNRRNPVSGRTILNLHEVTIAGVRLGSEFYAGVGGPWVDGGTSQVYLYGSAGIILIEYETA